MQTNLYDRKPNRSRWQMLKSGQCRVRVKDYMSMKNLAQGAVVMAMFTIFIVFVSHAYI